jgi:thioredoxin-related protein
MSDENNVVELKPQTLGKDAPIEQQGVHFDDIEELDTGWDRLKSVDFEDQINKDVITCVVFGSKTCKPCAQLQATINYIGEGEFDIEYYKFECRNTDEKTRGVVKKYEISTMPRTIFFKDGEEIGSFLGFAGQERTRGLIKHVLKNGKLVIDFDDSEKITKHFPDWEKKSGVTLSEARLQIVQDMMGFAGDFDADAQTLDGEEIDGEILKDFFDNCAHGLSVYYNFFVYECCKIANEKGTLDLTEEDLRDVNQFIRTHPGYEKAIEQSMEKGGGQDASRN